jgi:hypothetical protein
MKVVEEMQKELMAIAETAKKDDFNDVLFDRVIATTEQLDEHLSRCNRFVKEILRR